VTHVKHHSSVMVIRAYAFDERMQMVILILNDGLEEIGVRIFQSCTLIQRIVIPNTIMRIDHESWGIQ
jgi:hypothetical protein